MTGYRIYKRIASGNEVLIAEVVLTLFFLDGGLVNDVNYYYRISAVNLNGEGAKTDEFSVTPRNLLPVCGFSLAYSSGVVMRGASSVRGWAYDPERMPLTMEFSVDDGPWIRANWDSGWEYRWDTTKHSNGNHTLYARAYDGENYSEIVSLGVRVENAENMFEQAWFWVAAFIVTLFIASALYVERRGRSKKPPS